MTAYVESAVPQDQLCEIAATIESGLDENSHYRYARRLGQLGPLRASRPGMPRRRILRRASRGASALGTQSRSRSTLAMAGRPNSKAASQRLGPPQEARHEESRIPAYFPA